MIELREDSETAEGEEATCLSDRASYFYMYTDYILESPGKGDACRDQTVSSNTVSSFYGCLYA